MSLACRDRLIPLTYTTNTNPRICTQSNSRFYAAKDAVLQSLPEETTPEQREAALSAFYSRWVSQERVRQDEYNAEWRKRNWSTIVLGARVRYPEFVARMMHPFRRGG